MGRTDESGMTKGGGDKVGNNQEERRLNKTESKGVRKEWRLKRRREGEGEWGNKRER